MYKSSSINVFSWVGITLRNNHLPNWLRLDLSKNIIRQKIVQKFANFSGAVFRKGLVSCSSHVKMADQLWVTYCLNEDDIPNALALYFSLKRVLTTRKIGIIVSHKLPTSSKEVLRRNFDILFYLEEDRNVAGLKEEEFVKLIPLTFKSFTECVFLVPTMLVIVKPN